MKSTSIRIIHKMRERCCRPSARVPFHFCKDILSASTWLHSSSYERLLYRLSKQPPPEQCYESAARRLEMAERAQVNYREPAKAQFLLTLIQLSGTPHNERLMCTIQAAHAQNLLSLSMPLEQTAERKRKVQNASSHFLPTGR